MTRLEDRQTILQEISLARTAGARLGPACALAGIDPRTRRRWQGSDQADASAAVRADRRPEAARPTPSQALTAAERAQILAMANEPRFADAPPARIVPALADEGKIVGFEVHDSDTAEHAAHLARRTALVEGVHAMPVRPVLHGDNGATLKATTVLAMLHWLGISPSYSRPRVSDDNAFAEAVFRTAKYRPEFPAKGFADLEAARAWAARFVQWYNHEHRHSGIRYVTPAQRHAGEDGRLLGARHAVYQKARERNPRRWSRHTRNWTPVAAVTLNPERDAVTRTGVAKTQLSGSTIGAPAFPSRPGSAAAAARSEGDGRSRAARSHAQRSEPGEDGEHRTFPARAPWQARPWSEESRIQLPYGQHGSPDKERFVTRGRRQLR